MSMEREGKRVNLNLFRVDMGGEPDLIRELLRQRNASVELVDEIIALDKAWCRADLRLSKMCMDSNNANYELMRMQMGNPEERELANSILISTQRRITEQHAEVEAARTLLNSTLEDIGIILDGLLPVSKREYKPYTSPMEVAEFMRSF